MLTQVAEADPGENAWAANSEPLTQIGDEHWADYVVSADATFTVMKSTPSVKHEFIQPLARSPRANERQRQWLQAQKGRSVPTSDVFSESRYRNSPTAMVHRQCI